MIDTTINFIGKNRSLLSNDEVEQTQQAITNLQTSVASGTKDEIQRNIEQLNEMSRPFAERLMDQSISAALKGKKI
jgi:molecular chaperone HscA